MRFKSKLFLSAFIAATLQVSLVSAQTVDSTMLPSLEEKDTAIALEASRQILKEEDSTKKIDPRVRIPRKAALRSAILPGWGQVYNKKIWKVPIVYAALGVTGGIFINNITWYNRTKYAYRVAIAIQGGTDTIGSASYNKIYETLKEPFFTGTQGIQAEYLRTNRDYFRKNVDYAAIYFLIAWALNVVDATVDAHLSSFDISPDLSFRVQPGYSEMAGTAGMSLVLRVK